MVEEVGQHVEDGRLGQNKFLDIEDGGEGVGRKRVGGGVDVRQLNDSLNEQIFNQHLCSVCYLGKETRVMSLHQHYN